MFTIKRSYGKCEECALIEEPSCVLETNTPEGNLDWTRVLFVAENPAKDEIEQERPLVGKSGKTFREPYEKYFNTPDDPIWSTVSNVVLCITKKPDGTIGNPTKKEIDNCKDNLYQLISISDPEVIFCMGSSAAQVFDIDVASGYLKKCFQFHNWNGMKVYLVPHPSYINRKGGLGSKAGDEFEEGFLEVRKFLGRGDPDQSDILSFGDLSIESIFDDPVEKKETSPEPICNKTDAKEGLEESLILYQSNEKEPPRYKIDEKFYTGDYRLVDVQYFHKHDRLVYIFRDKNNKKIFYEPPAVTNNYYYYEAMGDGKIIEPFQNLQLRQCNFKERKRNNKCYESDVNIDIRHSVDYYIQNQEELQVEHQNIFFHDIEVYTFDDRSFPGADKAEHPIVLISFCLDNSPIETYLLKLPKSIDPKVDEWMAKFEGKERVTIFTSEEVLLQSFVRRMHELEPDIITAWNVSFDLGYIYNRLDRLNLNKSSLSKYDDCFIDSKSNMCFISGYIVLDMMTLYKNLRQGQEESYSLENVSQKILGHGKNKFSCPWFDLYEKYVDEFITYNIQDVQLLVELNEELRHIEMTDELRRTATTNWKGVSSTIGQAEGLFLSNLKRRGLCVRNRKDNVSKGPVAGAFVKEPVGGKYEWLVDFDFTSLYPNIVRTWNIGPNTYLLKVDEEVAFKLIYETDSIDKEEMIDVILDPIHSGNKLQWTVQELLTFIGKNKATINLCGCIFTGHEVEQSIFYEIYNFLLETRKVYKKQKFEEKDKTKKQVLDNKQWALKILANSLYGVLLNEYFRFYNPDLGLAVTRAGQEAIKFAGFHLNKYMTEGSYEFDPRFEKRCEDNLAYLLYIDTDSLFLKMGEYIEDKKLAPTVTTESILKTVGELTPILNDNIMGEFSARHNINPKYSYLELKQEIVSDHAYFLNAKKRYAAHIVNQEGNAVDYVDIKGIETQRSDFSQITKEMLKKILNMILTSDDIDIDSIMDYVEERKVMMQELCLEGHLGIGKPVGFGKPLKEYKTIPRAVRGMLLWNHLVYDYFKPGMKGTEIQVSGIDIDNAPEDIRNIWHEMPYIELNAGVKIAVKDIKSIVIPETEDKIPSYFKPDMKAIVAFSVEDRVELLLEPLFKRSNELLTF